MSKMNKVVITEFGDESKLAIVEDDLPDPAAREVQLGLWPIPTRRPLVAYTMVG